MTARDVSVSILWPVIWNFEEIDDSQNCQMSNVCCAMSDELVKRPTDEMT